MVEVIGGDGCVAYGAGVQSERDEFIKREHAEHLARTIPGAELVMLDGVSHFAPLQRLSYLMLPCCGLLAKFSLRNCR